MEGLTTYGTFAGLPASSWPVGFDQRARPMSTSRIVPPPRDLAVLSAARAYEAIMGDRRVGDG